MKSLFVKLFFLGGYERNVGMYKYYGDKVYNSFIITHVIFAINQLVVMVNYQRIKIFTLICISADT